MDNLVAKLYQSNKTILTNEELSLLWRENEKGNLNSKIAYYVKKKALFRLTRGVFSKDEKYDFKELATKIYTPSYVSFETVLREAGVIFQYYDSIFIATKWPKKVVIDKKTFVFRKLKDTVLYNSTGIVNKENYSIATTERAFLDMVYLFPNYYFDNLSILDWEKCFEIGKIYDNNQLIKRLNKYHENYLNKHVK